MKKKANYQKEKVDKILQQLFETFEKEELRTVDLTHLVSELCAEISYSGIAINVTKEPEKFSADKIIDRIDPLYKKISYLLGKERESINNLDVLFLISILLKMNTPK